MKHSFYISVLTSLLLTTECSSVSQNIDPINTNTAVSNTAVSNDDDDMAVSGQDETTETDDDSTAEPENSDADETTATHGANHTESDSANDDIGQDDKGKGLSQGNTLPICDLWRHRYGTDSDMTDNHCRLSDEAVEKLIQSGGDIHQWNDYGQTPVMLANSTKAIKALIEAGADVNHTDEFGKTALDYATSGEVVDLIVKAPGFAIQSASLNGFNMYADVAMALEKHGLLSLTIDEDFYLFKTALRENSLSGIKYYLDKILYSEQNADKDSALTDLYSTVLGDSGIAHTHEKSKASKSKTENSHNRQLAAAAIQKFLNTSTTAPIVEYLLQKGFSMELCPLSDPKAIAKLAKAGADKWCGGQALAITKTSSLKKLFELVDDDAKGIFAKRILLNNSNPKLVQYITDNKAKIQSLTPEDITAALINTTSDAMAKSLMKSTVLGNISASQINNDIVLSHYLEHGGDVNAAAPVENGTTGTLLNRAILLDNPQMVKTLLEAGASIKQADQYKKGSVHQALSSDSANSTKIAKQLIQAGAEVRIEKTGDPYDPWDNNNPLNRAIESNDTELVEMLIKADSFTPGDQDVWRYAGSSKMVKFLLKKGFKPNAKTWEQMIERDAPDSSSPKLSEKELKEIARILKPAILSEFKAHPAPDQETHRNWIIENMNLYLTTDGSASDKQTPEMHVMRYNQTVWSDGDDASGHWTRDSSILRNWLTQGGDCNKRDAEGKTPLMFADFAHEVLILTGAGADVNAKDNSGNTVLMVQIQSFPARYLPSSQSLSIVEALIQSGADIHTTNAEGKTALDIYNNLSKFDKENLPDLKPLL